MSGKRLLDVIAVGQVLSSIAQKAIKFQPGKVQIARDLNRASSASLGELPEFDEYHRREATSKGNGAQSGRICAELGCEQLLQNTDSESRDCAKTSSAPNSENKEVTRNSIRPSNDASDQAKQGRADEQQSKLVSKLSQPSISENEAPDAAYSQLFHSPRAAALVKKPPISSAWADLNFQTQSAPLFKPVHTLDNLILESIRESKPEKSPGSSLLRPTQAASLGEPRSVTHVHHQEVLTNTEVLPEQGDNKLQESKVPSTRFGRVWQYGGLATSLLVGAAGEGLRRSFRGTQKGPNRSIFMNDSNLEVLVSRLSRMRGAALKLGQMISFQDLKMLPGPVQDVLQRVQDSADYMPAWQRDEVLVNDLGTNWRELFSAFDEIPLAAASIGQVHAATFKATDMPVAVKIQYPGVAKSISSDLSNLSLLLTASRLLPKGLYLEKTIANARTELGWECDYTREAEAARRFNSLLEDDTSTFKVPKIVDGASGPHVLTMERMFGKAVTKIPDLPQHERDWIATNILRLCLRELFEFRYMQTDPNWTNFLYNSRTRVLELLDFGASRAFPSDFIDNYLRVLQAAAHGKRDTIVDLSVALGYLTGHESRAMRDAQVESVLILAEPFAESAPEEYNFQDQTITDRVRALVPVMLRERLSPPPEETYSLHRKLSGAFLLCARLGARVPARKLFQNAIGTWQMRS